MNTDTSTHTPKEHAIDNKRRKNKIADTGERDIK